MGIEPIYSAWKANALPFKLYPQRTSALDHLIFTNFNRLDIN